MPKKKKKINFGVIGLGMGRFHLEGYLKAPNAEVVGLADINENRLENAKDHYGIKKVFTDYKDLLDMKELDAVSIAVPNFLHKPITIDALKAGKHVMVEKPMALNAEEGQEMLETAKKNDLILMLHFNNRYRGDIQYIKKCVEAGDFGEIYFAKTGWIRRRGIPGAGGWFTTKAKSGGGPLIDLGVHVIDMTMYMMGSPKPVAVSGCVVQKFPQVVGKGTFDVEDFASGYVRFENGATMAVEISWAMNCASERQYSEIYGTKAGATLNPLTIWSDRNGILEDISPQNPKGLSQFEHFADCIMTGKIPISPGEHGVLMMKVLDAIYESSKTKKEVIINWD
ncbi:gfo/Idh/MocA family oxidoreductase [Candidatus Poribacteria bacterium]|nr:gfo/Idh/MocA family oxidoreductase [Candidatus Poribacteria bacterium]